MSRRITNNDHGGILFKVLLLVVVLVAVPGLAAKLISAIQTGAETATTVVHSAAQVAKVVDATRDAVGDPDADVDIDWQQKKVTVTTKAGKRVCTLVGDTVTCAKPKAGK